MDRKKKTQEILNRIIRCSIPGIAFFLPLSSGLVNSLIGVSIAALILVKVISKGPWFRPNRVNCFLALFFIISCISIINSIEPLTSVRGLVKVLKYCGIFFVMVEGIKDVKFLKRVLVALAAGAACVSLDGLMQYFVLGKDLLRSNPLMEDLGIKRITATYRHCNDFGVYLVIIAPIIWVMGRYVFKGRVRWLLIAIASMMTLCVALTFSRGAALGFFVAMLIMGIVKRDKLVLILLAIGLLLAPFLLPDSVYEWGKETDSWLEIMFNADRLVFFRTALAMIKAHPFIGVGVNAFTVTYPHYKVREIGIITPDTTYAHNNFLHMTAEIGFIGSAIFFLILAAVFIELMAAFKKKHRPFIANFSLGIMCGIVAFLLNGLTESSLYYSKIVVVFWFVAGMAVSLRLLKDE